jgi:hypothetical protein
MVIVMKMPVPPTVLPAAIMQGKCQQGRDDGEAGFRRPLYRCNDVVVGCPELPGKMVSGALSPRAGGHNPPVRSAANSPTGRPNKLLILIKVLYTMAGKKIFAHKWRKPCRL